MLSGIFFHLQFSKIFTATTYFEYISKQSFWKSVFVLEKRLQIVEAPIQPNEVEMDPEKLKFCNSKLKVRDFTKISSSEFQNLSFDNKLSILRKY